MMQFIHLTA